MHKRAERTMLLFRQPARGAAVRFASLEFQAVTGQEYNSMELQMNSKPAAGRLRFVDIAKGISIICIILGHLGIHNITRVVFTFHVPIFF